MTAITLRRTWAMDEFVKWDERQSVAHQYVDGLAYAMVGGTAAHETIAGNVFALILPLARARSCRAFGAGFRVLFREDALIPDAMVVCGAIEPDALWTTDATVVVEVLSPSTERLDRGRKRALYQTLPSLRHLLLVAQDRVQVEVLTRDGPGWVEATYRLLNERVPLEALGGALPLAAIYADSGVDGASDRT